MSTSKNDSHRRGKGLVSVRHLGVSLQLRILPSLRSVTDRVVRSLRDIAGERHYPSPQYCIDHAPRSVLAKPIEEWRGARPRPGTKTSSLTGRRCWRCGSRAGSRNPSGSAAQRSGPCAARRAVCPDHVRPTRQFTAPFRWFDGVPDGGVLLHPGRNKWRRSASCCGPHRRYAASVARS